MHHGLMKRRCFKEITKEGLNIGNERAMTRRQQFASHLEDFHNYIGLNRILPKKLKKVVKIILGVN